MKKLTFGVLALLSTYFVLPVLDPAVALAESFTTKTGGTLASNEVWTAAASPYQLTGSLFIPNTLTLTIKPGVTVYLASGCNITVSDGGRLLAEGTDTQGIIFAGLPESNSQAHWGQIVIYGSVGSPETRLAYVSFKDNGKTCIEVNRGTLSLDHATFGTTTHQYVSLDSASFLISNCYFPTTTAPFELLHGTGGIKAGGRGIVRHSFFGKTTGYNDVMDFTGGNRDLNQPIVQYYHNVFLGTGDDILDLDGTDAWIESNIFLHTHRNNSPDSASAVSGGEHGGRTSEITILGNLIYDCDNAAAAKEGNFYTLINNTIVHTTKAGGEDFASGVVNLRDTTPHLTAWGDGAYLEGNVIVNAEQLIRNYDPDQSVVTLNDNCLPMAWDGPGSGNIVVDPQLTYIPKVSETKFTTWQDAQILWNWFSLKPGSAAQGLGPNGQDMGGVIPLGASISGEPFGTTCHMDANLIVGINRTGYGIPEKGFPLGSGFISYRWRLDGQAWSDTTPIEDPITLTDLADGSHVVDVIGTNDAGLDQNDPALGQDAKVTHSLVWTVDPSYERLVINEVLAHNNSVVVDGNDHPALVELAYDGPGPLDLSGIMMSRDLNDPAEFVFPEGTTIKPRQYLVLQADANTVTPGLHLGFSLNNQSDALYLFAQDGTQLDSIEFGAQLTDLSIGRVGPAGQWRLTIPTPGAANVATPVGNPDRIRINEWLTQGEALYDSGFVELYNPQVNPVDLDGMALTNEVNTPGSGVDIHPLSFMAGQGYTVFWTKASQGSGIVMSELSSEGGTIQLFDHDLEMVDQINYGPQTADVSEGRVPDGADQRAFFPSPTPGAANPQAIRP